MEKIDRSRTVVYSLYLRLTFEICVLLYCAGVSLLSGCVCVHRGSGLNGASLRVSLWCLPRLPVSRLIYRDIENEATPPLSPSFCLSLKYTKSQKHSHPHHNHIFPSDKLQPELDTVSHTLMQGVGRWGVWGVGWHRGES